MTHCQYKEKRVCWVILTLDGQLNSRQNFPPSVNFFVSKLKWGKNNAYQLFYDLSEVNRGAGVPLCPSVTQRWVNMTHGCQHTLHPHLLSFYNS